MSDQWVNFLRGKEMAGHKLGELISMGAFSYVFEGHHSSGKRRAIKVLRSSTDPEAAEEFHRESGLLRQLSGAANVVELLDSGSIAFEVQAREIQLSIDFSYHVLELASGCLQEIVLNRETVEWSERIKLWRGVILGVHQMHLRNIVHRDLKSSNCLLFVKRHNLTQIKIADLGRSRDLGATPAHPRMLYFRGLGDLTFAPPEFLYLQGRNTVEAHLCADLYGLGSILYELATGQSITVMALGFGLDLVKRSTAAGMQAKSVDLTFLRSTFAPALDVLAESLPPAIRTRGTALVRKLCDPLPLARLPKSSPIRKKAGKDKGLEWLLREADILATAASCKSDALATRRRKGA